MNWPICYLHKIPNAQILAGGTDVGLWVTKQLRELPEIVYLGNVAGLDQVIRTDWRRLSKSAPRSALTDALRIELNHHYPEFG